MFGSGDYLEENTFSTGHQSVNVYGLPEKTYKIRSEDTAVDVQVHRNTVVRKPQSGQTAPDNSSKREPPVTDFNTPDTLAQLGTATADISEMVLRQIKAASVILKSRNAAQYHNFLEIATELCPDINIK